MSLQGKTAFITGGGKNLGALVASQLAAEGANIAIHYHGASTTKAAGSLQIFANVLEDFGKLDIVVNTVGMVLKKPLVDISEQDYDSMFAVNSKSAFFITQEAAKAVEDGGKIVNIVTALLAAYTGYYTAYQGSKGPVEWFTKGLSKEFMSRGLLDLYAQETEDSIAYLKSGAIDGRLTKIEDIGH
ncbi:hypothetical protein LTR09_008976 [Extremus antarcticus]|uniref:Short-chain dehydrogenase n=1 Tax=Extremus antarcticus TaxID=702011 RepID=A0AAJ0G9X3_9PEZI|nr:hypothetical protein LTR09_008976 [Extremus antarcticus]